MAQWMETRRTGNLAFFLHDKFSLRSTVFFLVLFLIIYLCWEYYWYQKVHFFFVKWHTHLMVYAYPFFGVWFLFRFFPKANNIKNSILIIILSLALVEFLLLVAGINKTSEETKYGYYVGTHYTSELNYYHVWEGSQITLEREDFSYTYPVNSLGFPDMEWKVQRDSSIKRIIAMGDSFTQGDGAPFDSSYVNQLRKLYKDNGHRIEIYNAGTCGSDPFFNFVNLRDRLLLYKPNVVIQTISENDIFNDIPVRGGMERFSSDKKIIFKDSPKNELLYAVSYLSRYFFKPEVYHKEGINKEIDPLLINLFDQYSILCKENNIDLLLVILPDRSNVERNEMDYDFSTLKNALDGRVQFCELLPFYIKTFIPDQNGQNPYWVKDGHHNSKGYGVMARGIYECLED